MNERTLKILEFDRICRMLSEQAVSPMAKEMALALVPGKQMEEIQGLLSETSEAVSVIVRKGSLPLGGLNPVEAAVLLAKKGGTLSPGQLLEIKQNLYTARKVAEFLKNDPPRAEEAARTGRNAPEAENQGKRRPVREKSALGDLAWSLTVLQREEREIDQCIISEDMLADDASAELRSIRRAIKKQEEALRSKMNSMIQSRDNQDMLQDSIITMRQGRFVIPVKQEHKAKFPGIIHDQSSTGATLFIEPQAIVNMNNELRELHLKEEAEIQRILALLSGMIALETEGILANQKILVQIDFMFAKARLALQMKAIEPELNDEGWLRIRKGRHPLIDRKTVVPMDIQLGKDYDTLVITGPNTGGKTVTLKTAGLMVLMTQAGLHIPAEPGTRMPVFKEVFADIGDEQSIEQSLSTFSSHMKNIVEIVRCAGLDCLVLLDELGAGTDPTEGAALAMAVLDDLLGKGAKTIATTHYTELKQYALTTPHVENGCMEFNVQTLSPTYRLIIGMAGKSNAFEISRKLGLPEPIIKKASGLIEGGDIEFEDLIARIDEDKMKAREEREEADRLRQEAQRLREQLQRQKEKFEAQKEKLAEQAREEARDLVAQAKAYSDLVFKELREIERMQQDPRTRNKKIEEIRSSLREKGRQYAQKEEAAKENREPLSRKDLRLGMRVRIVSLDQEGSLLSLPDEKGELLVQAGLMKITVRLEDLQKAAEDESAKQAKTRYGALYREKASRVSPNCDVRGCNLEEAKALVDKYIDDAYIAGLKQVSIIHGKGEGILRDGLKPFFKRHKHVESFRPGMYNEGADGVTILTLKEK